MTVLSFPAINNPSQITWRLRGLTQTHESPFDGSTQTLRRPGEKWEASLAWERLKQSDFRILSAWLAQLGGMSGRFFYTPVQAPRQAIGTGTPVVNGSTQTGSTISIRGWAANAQAFKSGDYLSYPDAAGRHLLYVATSDVTATSGGIASVPVAPPVRRSVADGTAVEIIAPKAVFRLTDDAPAIVYSVGPFGSISFDIVEALV